MGLIQMLLILLVFGAIWALVAKFLGIPAVVNYGITVVFIVILVIMLLQLVGVNVGSHLRLT